MAEGQETLSTNVGDLGDEKIAKQNVKEDAKEEEEETKMWPAVSMVKGERYFFCAAMF